MPRKPMFPQPEEASRVETPTWDTRAARLALLLLLAGTLQRLGRQDPVLSGPRAARTFCSTRPAMPQMARSAVHTAVAPRGYATLGKLAVGCFSMQGGGITGGEEWVDLSSTSVQQDSFLSFPTYPSPFFILDLHQLYSWCGSEATHTVHHQKTHAEVRRKYFCNKALAGFLITHHLHRMQYVFHRVAACGIVWTVNYTCSSKKCVEKN